MKKSLKVLIGSLLVMSTMVGCGKTSNTVSNNGEREKLRVAMDLKFPPFTGVDEEGNPEGLEVDIAYALGEYLNRDVEIVNTDYAMLIPALETGDADIVINDMSIKEERKEKVDFSDPYLYGRTIALVNKGFTEKNNITDDMTPEEFFSIEGARYVGLAGTISVTIPQSYGVEVNEITEIASGLMEINNGTADVLVGANTNIGNHFAYPDTTELYCGIKEYSMSAMAVKKGNTELLSKVNKFIKTMYEDGGLYKSANGKYDARIGEYLKDSSLGLDYMIYPPKQ